MSYPINYPTPQGANVQIFSAPRLYGTSPQYHITNQSWVKPQGASFVFFSLIGGGGGGAGYNGVDPGGGGGSAAVTNFMCPAFLIPDQLSVMVGTGGAGGSVGAQGVVGRESSIYYEVKAKESYVLLTAVGGSGGFPGAGPGSGGAAMSANNFTCMGFLNSSAGANGDTNTPLGTFLTGGTTSQANYYYFNNAGPGFFQMQPIIVSTGGGYSKKGGIGSGGGGGAGSPDDGGRGGDGLVVIVTW
jgi:hypothetical protein